MAAVPDTERAPLIRTDCTDDAAWVAFVEVVRRGDARSQDPELVVDPVEDPSFDGIPSADLNLPDAFGHRCFYVYDDQTAAGADFPVLVVGAGPDDRPRTFRTAARDLAAVQVALTTGGAGWRDLAAGRE